jgi:hypothetical protein
MNRLILISPYKGSGFQPILSNNSPQHLVFLIEETGCILPEKPEK